jgi:hypothetical protein
MTETYQFSFSNSKGQMRQFWLVNISIAAIFRFVSLGQYGFWGDEGYSAHSAQGILEYGYPCFSSECLSWHLAIFVSRSAVGKK